MTTEEIILDEQEPAAKDAYEGSSAEKIARDREQERRDRMQHRQVRRVLHEIEVMLKNTKFCRYRLVYFMQALDKVVASIALTRPAGSAQVRLDGDKVIVEVSNKAMTSSQVRDMVDQAMKETDRYNIAKALLEMDEYSFVTSEAGGVTLRVAKRLDQ